MKVSRWTVSVAALGYAVLVYALIYGTRAQEAHLSQMQWLIESCTVQSR